MDLALYKWVKWQSLLFLNTKRIRLLSGVVITLPNMGIKVLLRNIHLLYEYIPGGTF
ncbi:hypothetical protein Hanom_Chr01g00061361 [Helianthus anomalus]